MTLFYFRSLFILLLTLVFLVPPKAFAATAECGLFSRSMSLGVSGNDVLALQQILNSDARTAITSSGPGSFGNETTHFGPLTKSAVMRFQELYKTEVLLPAGLDTGTGYVGTLTRAKLVVACMKQKVAAQRAASAVTLPIAPPSVPTSSPLVIAPPATPESPVATPPLALPSIQNVKSDTPIIMYPSSYTLHPGDTLSIAALGLLDHNDLHIGATVMSGLAPNVGGQLSVTIPKEGLMGPRDVWITNQHGESNKTIIVIVPLGAHAPTITSVTPESGHDGSKIVVTGTNFTPANNTVRGGMNDIPGLTSPDGKTLEFSVSLSIPGVSSGQDVSGVDVTVPYWFYVVNDNGVSNNAVYKITY